MRAATPSATNPTLWRSAAARKRRPLERLLGSAVPLKGDRLELHLGGNLDDAQALD
jgi:hypothetical protein